MYAAVKNEIEVSATEDGQETKLPNGISVFGNDEEVARLKDLVFEIESIRQDTGDIINIPEHNWMTVPLNTDWNSTSAPKLGQKTFPVKCGGQGNNQRNI